MLIESMFDFFDDCVNLYETENGKIVLTYERAQDNETLKREFSCYESAVNYLYKKGFIF